MIFTSTNSKNFMCPLSASGPKQFGCKGNKCAAFKLLDRDPSRMKPGISPLWTSRSGEIIGTCAFAADLDHHELHYQLKMIQEPQDDEVI